MYLDEKIGLSLIGVLTVAALITLVLAQGQQEYVGMPMNASILQPICIVLSGNLSQGIFFTNKTTIGVQYPIRDMTVKNNATGNYWGPSYGTVYNVTACPGNTINVSVYQSACDNLKNDTNIIYLTWNPTNAQGGFIGNATSPTGFAAESTYFTEGYSMLVDAYRLVAERIWPVGQPSIYLRYWLDPWPDNAPSGIYNTTYKIRAEEVGVTPTGAEC
jgi:hypothetical protein